MELSRKFNRRILACGAELKNTIAAARDGLVLISPDNGDLENPDAMARFEAGIKAAIENLGGPPDAVAHDMHPEYLSSKFALTFAGVKDRVAVQHHHAHAAGAIAASGADGPVIGVVFDGLGYGLDGAMWGGEFLVASRGGFSRVVHLKQVRLPGGAVSIRRPWRMAASHLYEAFGEDFTGLNIPFSEFVAPDEWAVLKQMIDSGFNSPFTTSMGRLFDAAASLVLEIESVSHEAQAAIGFQKIAESASGRAKLYDFALNEAGDVQTFGALDSVPPVGRALVVDVAPIIRGIARDIENHVAAPEISAGFHNTVATLTAEVCSRVRRDCGGLNDVVLSGGVFQNALLVSLVKPLLAAAGFNVLAADGTPVNDAGISLGQAVVADEILSRREGR